MEVDHSHLPGRWKNQLGSEVVFEADDGQITGEYWTAVSSAGTPLPGKKIFGTYQIVPGGAILVNWIAQWQVPSEKGVQHSSTSWTGILRNGKLKTHWLLISAEKQEWERLNIGADLFKRI